MKVEKTVEWGVPHLNFLAPIIKDTWDFGDGRHNLTDASILGSAGGSFPHFPNYLPIHSSWSLWTIKAATLWPLVSLKQLVMRTYRLVTRQQLAASSQGSRRKSSNLGLLIKTTKSLILKTRGPSSKGKDYWSSPSMSLPSRGCRKKTPPILGVVIVE